jgi:hypothetical protein
MTPRLDPRPRCGATTRQGGPCRKTPVAGHWRCRFHGGLSTGPRNRFAVTPAQQAALRAALPGRIAAMQAGRMEWLARLKAAGEKAPCGRKPRDFDPLLASLNRRDRARAKADAKRIEGPYRRIKRECEREAARRAMEERVQAELRRVAEENDDPTKRPDETWEENAARFACIMERRRRARRRL